MLEVTEGLKVGEEVVDDLSHLEDYDSLIVDAPPARQLHEAAAKPTVAASQPAPAAESKQAGL
jgi:hypothetical protein